jgi:hypothetical protein
MPIKESVMNALIRLALASAALLGNCVSARAEEQMVPLAISGDWVAMAHRPDMIARADVCIVFDAKRGVALRSGNGVVQLRVTNSSWSLPADVQGNITVNVDAWNAIFEIDDNTDTMVNAEIADNLIEPMFAAMDKASNMSITVGKAKPVVVSLSGSTRATNAFRTCAGIQGNTKAPGSNPFQ